MLFRQSDPVHKIAPQIFKRPILTVTPSDPLVYAASFLAIGPQIYVDGLVIVEDGRVVGRLGNLLLMQQILSSGDRWLLETVSDIKDFDSRFVEARSPVREALDIFEKTRFAFLPITVDGIPAASLSLRDLLGAVAESNIKDPASRFGSSLVSLSAKTNLLEVLTTMMSSQIRNVGIKRRGGTIKIINDRKILEFLLSHDGRKLMKGKELEGLKKIPVQSLDLLEPKTVNNKTSISKAASLLNSVDTPCLLSDGLIVTPWDLVIKGLRSRK